MAYVDDLETRLTALRAGYLDELGPTNIPADIDGMKGTDGGAAITRDGVADLTDVLGDDPPLEDMIRAIYNKMFNASSFNRTTGELSIADDDGTTIMEQDVTDDATTGTKSKARTPA